MRWAHFLEYPHPPIHVVWYLTPGPGIIIICVRSMIYYMPIDLYSRRKDDRNDFFWRCNYCLNSNCYFVHSVSGFGNTATSRYAYVYSRSRWYAAYFFCSFISIIAIHTWHLPKAVPRIKLVSCNSYQVREVLIVPGMCVRTQHDECSRTRRRWIAEVYPPHCTIWFSFGERLIKRLTLHAVGWQVWKSLTQ